MKPKNKATSLEKRPALGSVEEKAWKLQNQCVSYVWLLRRETELTRDDRERIARLLEELFRHNTPHSIQEFRKDFARVYAAPPGHCILCKDKLPAK